MCLCSPFTVRRFLEQMPPTPYPLHLPPPALSAHNVTISAPKTLGLSAPNLVLPLSPTPRTPIHSFVVVLEFVYLPPSLPPMSIRPPSYFVSSRNSLRCPSSSNSSSSCTRTPPSLNHPYSPRTPTALLSASKATATLLCRFPIFSHFRNVCKGNCGSFGCNETQLNNRQWEWNSGRLKHLRKF